jgi:hypothetical protein
MPLYPSQRDKRGPLARLGSQIMGASQFKAIQSRQAVSDNAFDRQAKQMLPKSSQW